MTYARGINGVTLLSSVLWLALLQGTRGFVHAPLPHHAPRHAGSLNVLTAAKTSLAPTPAPPIKRLNWTDSTPRGVVTTSEEDAEEEARLASDFKWKLKLGLPDALALADRFLDTLEDAFLHFRRAATPMIENAGVLGGCVPAKLPGTKPRLVVLGTGWGAHSLAKVIDTDLYEVLVVSPRNYFVFTPLLAGASVGTVNVRSITEPIRSSNPCVRYVEGEAVSVLPEERKVVVNTPRLEGPPTPLEIAYDRLVYAVGAKAGTFGVEGVEEHCFVLKEVKDAQRLRAAIVRRFEEASVPGVSAEVMRRLLSFVVVGTGPTGVEFTGELVDLIETDIPRFFPMLYDKVTVTVVSATQGILPMFDKVLQDRGMAQMKDRGVELLLGHRVESVAADDVVLGNGRRLPYSLCFWAGGIEPRPLTRQLVGQIAGQAEAEGARRSQLTVDGFLRVVGSDGSILALGDAAMVAGANLPATGQVAAQQGAYVARLLNRGYNTTTAGPPKAGALEPEDGKGGADPLSAAVKRASECVSLRGRLEALPFHFIDLGLLAYVGSGQAIAEVRAGNNTSILDAAGEVGFLLWRSTYAVKQVSFRTRLDVLLDWLKTKTFGRDLTRLF